MVKRLKSDLISTMSHITQSVNNNYSGIWAFHFAAGFNVLQD